MKTYKQFMLEAKQSGDFPGRDDIVKKYNKIVSKFGRDAMLRYLNKKILAASKKSDKELPEPMIPVSKDHHERFNIAGITIPWNPAGPARLNIKPSGDLFELSTTVEANFRSVSYIGSKTWYKYQYFLTLLVDADLNVKEVRKDSFSVSGSLRSVFKQPKKGSLDSVYRSAMDIIIDQATKDLVYDTKVAAKQHEDDKDSDLSTMMGKYLPKARLHR